MADNWPGRGRAQFVEDPDQSESTSSSLSASPSPPLRSLYNPRQHRPSYITVAASFPDPLLYQKPKKPKPKPKPKEPVNNTGTLANQRENAFRFLRSVIAQHSALPKTEVVQSLPPRHKPVRLQPEALDEEMRSTDILRHAARHSTPGLHGSQSPRGSVSEPDRWGSSGTPIPSTNGFPASNAIPEERPVASGNGVSVSINMAEPVLFLQGFDQSDSSQRSTAMLRGNLHLKVSKNSKIKAVTLKFKGTAMTKWPEGIPPKKVDFEEVDTLMSHTWPFFNAQFPTAEGGSCADHVRLATGQTAGGNSPYASGSPAGSSANLPGARDKRLSLSAAPSKSFDKDSKPHATIAQKGYRTFYPGDYIYNFELPLDSRLPETIDVDLGSVKYELEATVERAGAFRSNLAGHRDVLLIRSPSDGSLEQVEPIAISRNWEDQLHYDIVISGKSFPLGAKIPIAFKLTPLAKVQCHRIKVFITENTEYFCSNKRVHRMEPTRKVLLYEKRADGTTTSTFAGSTSRILSGGGIPFDQREAAARGDEVTPQDSNNLLGALESETNIGPTEMEFSVQLPGCHQATDREKINRLHYDTTYQNIQVHHWIKIVMRLSKPDKDDPSKRRHFEISIDSPFHILSCRANIANTSLPAYSSPDTLTPTTSLTDCGCPGAPKRRISPQFVPTLNNLGRNSADEGTSLNEDELPMRPNLARPPTAHVNGQPSGPLQRPIHLLRAPSFNPPAFDAEQPPPPLATPPPQYNDIASPTAGHGLADYFSRLADAYDDATDSDEDGRSQAGSVRGRVNIPLTPGGRINRSFDMRRSWVPVGQ